MNWERAKNLIIVCLIIVNFILFGLNQILDKPFYMTGEQEAAIRTVFQNNGITLMVDLPNNYEPLPQLELRPFEKNLEFLRNIFFSGESAVLRTEEFNQTILQDEAGTGVLSVTDSAISYRSEAVERADMDREKAMTLCYQYMGRFGDLAENFIFDYYKELDNGYIIEFREVYKNTVIHGNYIKFYVTDRGIATVDFMYNQPVDFTNVIRDICSPDEALLTAMTEIKNSFGAMPVTVEKMDIVYGQTADASSISAAIKAFPYYRIYLDQQLEPIMVNAYTNQITNFL